MLRPPPPPAYILAQACVKKMHHLDASATPHQPPIRRVSGSSFSASVLHSFGGLRTRLEREMGPAEGKVFTS